MRHGPPIADLPLHEPGLHWSRSEVRKPQHSARMPVDSASVTSFRPPWSRARGYYRRTAASWVFRRPFAIRTQLPLISFTFDDFPQSALLVGGAILNRFGLAGTYYASLGLVGTDTPSGRIFVPSDLPALLEHGHELGCHTFSHCHSGRTKVSVFLDSIIQNQLALSELLPGAFFRTLSYPISPPQARTKQKVAGHFMCCRGGGQTFNAGTADLNYLSAYFLEKSRGNIQAVRDVVDVNRDARGWLILATHDISPTPSPFGCTPDFFEDVVRYAVSSGARILPVIGALEALGVGQQPTDGDRPCGIRIADADHRS